MNTVYNDEQAQDTHKVFPFEKGMNRKYTAYTGPF